MPVDNSSMTNAHRPMRRPCSKTEPARAKDSSNGNDCLWLTSTSCQVLLRIQVSEPPAGEEIALMPRSLVLGERAEVSVEAALTLNM